MTLPPLTRLASTPTSSDGIPHGPLPRRPQPRIAVVGGSLTGCTAALLLRQAGFDQVTVYEAAPHSAPRGGGLIGLEHPALDTLDRLGIDQDEIVAHRSETIWQVTVRARQHTHTARRTYPGRNTTWNLLHTALTARLPDGMLHTHRRVTGLTGRQGQPLLHFTDGTTRHADLVLFADGRTSTGRRLLDPDRPLRYAGYVAHRG
ncbi:monooxygenase, partial [Micromonospora fluostatini]